MKIEISDIRGYYPDGYTEQKYIDASINRIKGDGQDIVTYNTPEKYQAKNDTQYKNRKIQTVFFNKYLLSFFITESVNINLLSIAKTVLITLDNGDIHKAELIDVPIFENVQNTDFKEVTISYRDLKSKTTVNHLESYNLTDGISRFKSGLTNTYSPLYCKFDVTDYERDENSDNGIIQVSRDIAFKVVKFYAYISETSLITIKSGMSAVYLDDFVIEFNGETYQALEVPEIEELEDEFEGIKGIIVTLKYEQIINYPYQEEISNIITISANPTFLNFDLIDIELKDIAITTNSPSGWGITNVSDTWITAFKSSNYVSVSVSTATTKRAGTIEVTSLDDSSVKAIINIYQGFPTTWDT